MSAIDRLTAALADHYRIDRELGAGGMATVYLARDLKHDRDVAIKVLRPEIAEVLGAERFLQEIKTTANLRHPHILPLYDSGEAGGALYYVMPLVEGETLRDRLEREKQLPIADALRIATEVSDALSYAHARGVVHRDIKPENILLEGNHAFVADFGIARAVSAAGGQRLTQTGMSVGTPYYMSPEQASGADEMDGRSDLYSLACVLYEMLGGQAPFTGANVAAIVRQHLMVDAPPITNLRPAVPAHVAGALQRALAKNPADRFNPMAQFSAALHADGVQADSASAGAAVAAGAAAAAALLRAAEPNQAKLSRWRAWAALGLALTIIVAVLAYQSMRKGGSSGNADAGGIAVLPFSDLSPDHADAYLGDGIAETLISALANVSGLTVAARTSAFSFRNRSDDLKSIGRSLSVSTVLEGSVQRAGDRLRVTTRLVKVSDGRTIWSQTFDRATADIFAVQDEVVRSVVTAIQGNRVATGSQIGPAVGTRDREAYDLYLQGTFLLNRRSLPDIERAATLFERAIGRDSAFASAWAGLADARLLKCFVSTVNPLEQLPRARLAAERALRLAPDLAEPHVTLAYLLLVLDWNYAASDSAFRDAVARFPRNVNAHKWYADLLDVTARRDSARSQVRQALTLDPESPIVMYNYAVYFTQDGQEDSAVVWLNRSVAAAPDLALAHMFLAQIHGLRGDSARYFAATEHLESASGRFGVPAARLRSAWSRGGYKATLRELVAASQGRGIAYERALWLADLGDVDGVIRAAEESVERHEIFAPFLASPRRALAAVKKDPRWASVRKRLGLPAASVP